MRSCFFALLLSILTGTSSLHAAESKIKAPPLPSPVSVKAEVDRAFLTIGDPVIYTVTIKHPENVQVLSQIPPPSAEDALKIKKIEDIRGKEDGQIVEGRKFVLTAFALGEYVLDPIEIQYRIGGGDVQKAQTNRIYLTVKSVAEGEEKKDIRGIKSVLAMAISRWAWIILGSILFLLAGLLIVYPLSRRRKNVVADTKPLLSAEEEALIALQQLYESDMLRKGQIKLYHLRLSEILRHYFERRYKIQAIEWTTFEILRALREISLDLNLREKIKEVLEAADLAKFAKWVPEPKEIMAMYQQSKAIIEEARPKPEPVSSPKVKSHGL